MAIEDDVLNAAREMVAKFGSKAELTAVARMEVLMKEGDMAGAKFWSAVVVSIRMLTGTHEP